jgi:glycosyltransferase involved in cell wall biosynthesis
MNILFVHQNFPAQFKYLAPALANKKDNTVLALTLHPKNQDRWKNIQQISYATQRDSSREIHPWINDIEAKIIRAEACFKVALQLRSKGFQPDIIIAHPGWGESLFLKDVWPQSKLGIYCEFFYHARGMDIDFDQEFHQKDDSDICRIKLKNINNFLHFDSADAGLSPTHWQASTFPETFRHKITVSHDGIDTDQLKPNAAVTLNLNKANGNHLVLSKKNEIITFVNRNLEPCRGYHIFMRALPAILEQRPNAIILIVGGEGVSYGKAPDNGQSWKDTFIEEVRPHINDQDWQRVSFLGKVPYKVFIALLQLSTVHIYLTYPFVLSWSLLEAMSIGCAIVASKTAPLAEAIQDQKTGRLVDFFDTDTLVNVVCDLLDNPSERQRLGTHARQFAQQHYDLKRVCLPTQIKWVQQLVQQA